MSKTYLNKFMADHLEKMGFKIYGSKYYVVCDALPYQKQLINHIENYEGPLMNRRKKSVHLGEGD